MTTAQAQSPLITAETIRTASLYPLATLEARTAGTARVLVTRYWPRGVKRERVDAWWRDAAPTAEMLRLYRHGAWDWGAFARTYIGSHWWHKQAREEYIAGLIATHGALTLLCVEHCPRDGHDEGDVRCHRRLLRDLLVSGNEGETQP